jgi:hypothetical protein
MPVDSEVNYAELVGSLLYLTTNTRPDVAYAVGVLSRFMSKPMDKHWTAAKRVLRYLAGTHTLGLFYSKDQRGVSAYSDADFAGDIDQRKSTSGHSWASKMTRCRVFGRSCKINLVLKL